jgi:hypothetical protein
VRMWTPVAFPPGRFKLGTNPALTGSPLPNTIGTKLNDYVLAFHQAALAQTPVEGSDHSHRILRS